MLIFPVLFASTAEAGFVTTTKTEPLAGRVASVREPTGADGPIVETVIWLHGNSVSSSAASNFCANRVEPRAGVRDVCPRAQLWSSGTNAGDYA